MEGLSIALGIVILGMGAMDLFRTVLDYGASGPISRWIYRLAWRLARAAAGGRSASLRDMIFATAGPTMLLTSVATWVIFATLGFALLYLPAMPAAFSFQDFPDEPVVDALYFSLVSLSTVGFGDIVPTTGGLRLIAALEGLTGFAILTLTLSYLLGVYQVVRDQGELAAWLDDQVGGSDRPLDLVTSLLRHHATDASLSELHRALIAHNEGLHRYPLAYYFRRRDAHRSALFVLRLTGEAAALLRWVLPAGHPSSESPALAGLIAAERRLIGDVRNRFLIGKTAEVPRHHVEARWRSAVAHLESLGIEAETAPSDNRRRAAWTDFMVDLESVVLVAAQELRFDEREIGPVPAA